MDDDRCLKEEAWMEGAARIARDAKLRSEMLWLLAMQMADQELVRDLEDADPDLRRRVSVFLEGFDERIEASPEQRRDWFARHWDAHQERHLDLRAVVCACPRCIVCREC